MVIGLCRMFVGQKEGVRVGVGDGFKIDFEPSGDVFE